MGQEANGEQRRDDDLAHMAPTLRCELIFRPQVVAGRDGYVVEDPVNVRFFRIGLSEYGFLSRLDGQRTIRQVWEETRRTKLGEQLSEVDALAICHWAIQSGLATHELAHQPAHRPRTAAASAMGRRRRLGPLSVQLPLCHPDRLVQKLTPLLGWVFSTPALFIWLIVLGWAARGLVAHGHRLAEASSHVVAAENWLWLIIAWIVLKGIHECGHAVACKRRGGEVREAGVIFILLAPLAYVDVTSSWRLPGKWERISIAAAGMYVELFLAALAAILWVRLPVGALSQICLNVMLTASVMTVLFNANPLMRFDGYYILSDLLEIPNLYPLGQQAVRHLGRRLFFGIGGNWQGPGGYRSRFVRVYGLLCWGWRYLVFCGLVLTAATLLEGAGIVISLIAVILWLAALARRAIRLVRDSGNEKPNWFRFAVVAGGMATVGAGGLCFVPWPGAVTAPGIVRYAPETIVRAGCCGFVERVCVREGARVVAGQVLLELSNESLRDELIDLGIQIKQARIQQRIHQRHRELAKAQAESERLLTLERQYNEKNEEVAQLVVRAPRAGQIVTRNLSTLVGTYQRKGNQLMMIGDEATKEVRLSIAQASIVDFRQHQGGRMHVIFSGTSAFEAPLSKVEPRASRVPLAPSLCAPNGGTLTVRDGEDETTGVAPQRYELISPRFTGVIQLTPEQGSQLRAGQRVMVAWRGRDKLGDRLWHVLSNWIDRKLQRRAYRVAGWVWRLTALSYGDSMPGRRGPAMPCDDRLMPSWRPDR